MHIQRQPFSNRSHINCVEKGFLPGSSQQCAVLQLTATGLARGSRSAAIYWFSSNRLQTHKRTTLPPATHHNSGIGKQTNTSFQVFFGGQNAGSNFPFIASHLLFHFHCLARSSNTLFGAFFPFLYVSLCAGLHTLGSTSARTNTDFHGKEGTDPA